MADGQQSPVLSLSPHSTEVTDKPETTHPWLLEVLTQILYACAENTLMLSLSCLLWLLLPNTKSEKKKAKQTTTKVDLDLSYFVNSD